jgi:hypothetical protein
MSEYDEAQERYCECVKDLDGTLHVGGFPARAIVVEIVNGRFVLWKADLRPDTAINLAKSLAKNEERNWVRIHCVNQKTKTRVDTIHREAKNGQRS